MLQVIISFNYSYCIAFGTTKDSNLMRSITGNIGTKPRSAIWTKTLKYVQGRDWKWEDVSFVIAFNKCRKEILDHLKANKKYQNILLKTFDWFKDYVLEQFIFVRTLFNYFMTHFIPIFYK